MLEYYKWVRDTLPLAPTDKGIDLIEKGYVTIHGRDYKMRPCIILNFGVLAAEVVRLI